VAGTRETLVVGSLQGALVAGALALWELGARRGWFPQDLVSRPAEVGRVLGQWIISGFLWPHLAATLEATVAGLAVGVVLGVGGGLLAALVPGVGTFLEPLMSTLNATPRVVFYPILALWLGLGIASKVALVVTIVSVLNFFTTVAAVRTVDRTLVAQVLILGASPGAMLRHLYLPATWAWTAASLRTSVGLAFVGAVVGEYMGALRGIGHVIIEAQHLFHPAQVMAGLALTLALAGAIDAGLGRLAGRWLAWQREDLHGA
jgi:NitT/TauT family transport system permease protein